MGKEDPLVPPPTDYKGNFFKGMSSYVFPRVFFCNANVYFSLIYTDVAVALVGVGICNSESIKGDELILDKDTNISKFLNRILGLPVDLQNRLFQYFTDTLSAIVSQAKKSGRYDLGILDLGSGQDDVRRTQLYTFTDPTGTEKIELHTFKVERGMSWDVAKEKWSVLLGENEGFYLSTDVNINLVYPFLSCLLIFMFLNRNALANLMLR